MTVNVRTRHVVATVLAVAALLGAIAAGAVTIRDGHLTGRGAEGNADVRLGVRGFPITGNAAKALSPGRSAPINVRFTNRRRSALRVTQLRVSVRKVLAPNADVRHPCTLRDFIVTQVRHGFTVTVPARSTRTLSRMHVRRSAWPRVGMVSRSTNQDGCKGASLTLAFVGSGTLRR
jgi:hypothetical protein